MKPNVVEPATLSVTQDLFGKQKRRAEILRTEPLSARKQRLKQLASWIKANRNHIQQAIYADFRKPPVETDAIEIFAALTEINQALTNLEAWAKPRKVDAPVTMLGTRSVIRYEPKGVCLIISPWNYPFNLAIGPLVSALAAGNCAIIKPSELTPATSALLAKLCSEVFEESVVAVIEGGVEVSQHLLSLPFDHIFFTGSPAVGKLVMEAAARHLTSVTLELGGKSPVIITPSVRLRDAAKRIVVAKFINNGQTCIAPDYLLVHESVLPEVVNALKEEVVKRFTVDGRIEDSPHYARIVNDKHFNRINDLVQDAIAHGANLYMTGPVDASARLMHPIILTGVSLKTRIMEEEIFGPVLPVLSYNTLDEAIQYINQKPKPLALYIFGSSKNEQEEIMGKTSSGAVCINDCAIHYLHPNLPFGGVNNSGIGKSHGHHGFLAFSNEKPVLRQRKGFTSVQLFYPPYTQRAKKIIDWFIRFL
jgi:aldehyde dehydrogenase (NAD+)